MPPQITGDSGMATDLGKEGVCISGGKLEVNNDQ
jgi:hypothetical protein